MQARKGANWLSWRRRKISYAWGGVGFVHPVNLCIMLVKTYRVSKNLSNFLNTKQLTFKTCNKKKWQNFTDIQWILCRFLEQIKVPLKKIIADPVFKRNRKEMGLFLHTSTELPPFVAIYIWTLHLSIIHHYRRKFPLLFIPPFSTFV